MLADEDIEYFRDHLLALREELLSLTETRQQTAATVALDQSSVGRLSRMDALQQQAIALDSQRRAGRSLVQIDDALVRCRQGRYGLCLDCQEPIAKARLEFDPTSLRCINCASSRECPPSNCIRNSNYGLGQAASSIITLVDNTSLSRPKVRPPTRSKTPTSALSA